jgi:acetylornithine deacetylase/succinyl-diaminopimelate desuccinylase-like protein
MTPAADPLAELWDVFERAVACDTAVRAGEHRVQADDPRLAAFAETVAGPLLEAIGAATRTDSAGNLVATFGPISGSETLFVAYPATHHGNDTADPLRARREVTDGLAEWVGQGANEGKAPFAALIEALRRSVRDGVPLSGRVIVAVSTEGSSSNESSTVLFDELERLPAAAVLLVGTENRVALGHRGRADVRLTTHGPAMHSSAAAGLPNPISAICAAERAVQSVAAGWSAQRDGRSITPYRLQCGPIAPHTMPAVCELVLDCRFLAGDDVAEVCAQLVTAIADPNVSVAVGPMMLPAGVDPGSPLVERFRAAAAQAGTPLETFTPTWTFDAGAAHRRGIPAVLFGPSTERLASITSTDAVAVDTLREAADLLTALIDQS